MLVVCAILRNPEGEILLCRRGPGRREAGLWEFPGGKVEEGESPVEALARELHEELAIECAIGIEVARNTHPYAHGTIELIALEAHIVAGDLELRDHDQYAWVAQSSLPHYGLAPADIPIAHSLSR